MNARNNLALTTDDGDGGRAHVAVSSIRSLQVDWVNAQGDVVSTDVLHEGFVADLRKTVTRSARELVRLRASTRRLCSALSDGDSET